MSDMMDDQKRLQEETCGYDFSKMTTEDRIDFIKWNILALSDELHEALAETGWKPWSSSRHINVDPFKGELIDAWHFFMNLCIVVGMDTTELEVRYQQKHKLNVKRQQEGYDGVSTKCPFCKRALDDNSVTCHAKNEEYWTCMQHGTMPYTTEGTEVAEKSRKPYKTRRYYARVALPRIVDEDALFDFIDSRKKWNDPTMSDVWIDDADPLPEDVLSKTWMIAATYGPVRGNSPSDLRDLIVDWVNDTYGEGTMGKNAVLVEEDAIELEVTK